MAGSGGQSEWPRRARGGAQAVRALASSCVTHTPARSPCVICFTGCLNICIDLTLRVVLSSGNSISCPMARLPESTVPVMTVPCPLIGKQWSMAKCSGPSGSRFGTSIMPFSVLTCGGDGDGGGRKGGGWARVEVGP